MFRVFTCQEHFKIWPLDAKRFMTSWALPACVDLINSDWPFCWLMCLLLLARLLNSKLHLTVCKWNFKEFSFPGGVIIQFKDKNVIPKIFTKSFTATDRERRIFYDAKWKKSENNFGWVLKVGSSLISTTEVKNSNTVETVNRKEPSRIIFWKLKDQIFTNPFLPKKWKIVQKWIFSVITSTSILLKVRVLGLNKVVCTYLWRAHKFKITCVTPFIWFGNAMTSFNVMMSLTTS